MSRELRWDDCVNVRDLGGLPTLDGGTTRSGSVIRSDTVASLTGAGWEALVAHGVTTILDLRSPDEVAADAPLDIQVAASIARGRRPPIRTVNVPLIGTWSLQLEARFEAAASAESEPEAATRAVYMTALTLFPANVRAAVEAVADAPDGGVLIHCQAGKDRTGQVCALLLLLAGVAPEAVADDYALSGPNIAAHHDVWVEQAPDERERQRRRRIGLSPRGAMVQLVAAIDDRFGGVEGYLRSAGADDELFDRVRARLR